MQKKLKVTVSDCEFPNFDQERAVIEAFGADLEICHCTKEEELIQVLKTSDAVLNQYAKLTPRVLGSLERCKVIVRYGIGVDNVDLPAATKAGIAVCNVPRYGLHEVSDHCIALLFSCIRKIPLLNTATKGGSWDMNLGRPIKRITGSTLGLVGFGNIPKMMIRKLEPWGLRILVHDPFVNDQTLSDFGVNRASIEEILEQSDYVSVHAPLTPQTHLMFNYEAFSRMKKDAVFINTARGPLVDEEGLCRALQEKQIAAAGIDVMVKEPAPPTHPLFQQPLLTVSPHIAFYSEESCVDLQRMAAEEIVRVLRGEEPQSCVNPQVFNR